MTSKHLHEALPEHLRERVLRVGSGPDPVQPADGKYVLYWMRTGVRGHDNPALDAALEVGHAIGLPVFVFLQLSEAHPWSAARHHRFFIEGARDVQAELAERGVGFAFHLERAGHRGPHLRTLAASAALIITEDLPVTPLDRWTEAFAEVAEAPVWAVDTACTWPMRRVRADVTTRAFKFRRATERGRMERVRAGWLEWGRDWRPDATIERFVPELTFEPLELAEADLDALVAQCRVDHGIAPVPHTVGGSRAGYARWQAFKQSGLRGYHRTRNDPLRDGVSRMSAYLHFGHVSPFRLAREALEVGGEGAEKYLDELLTWRELAHSWCAHHPDRDSLGAIPDWARETLAAHESDRREALHSWETLARGRTGDELWDAAQRSLLIHGELHNNVRMTWGKALLGWTRDAAEALEQLIDLNHRYALDGRDPSSYGGLLWCLGQFDRAFEPEQTVIGTVRPRPTAQHARRLDVDEYARRTARPARPTPPRVAVVGAGVAGLACARTLLDHGLEVQVFDKGRRPGGRLATRETRGVPERWFDHGAQYFTARDPRFQPYVRSWAEDGLIELWSGRVIRVDAEGRRQPRDATGHDDANREAEGPTADARRARADEARWVAPERGLHTLAAHLARDLDVRCGLRIASLEGAAPQRPETDAVGAESSAPHSVEPTLWHLLDTDGARHGPFEAVVITAPAPQAADLLHGAGAPDLEAAARTATLDPCWTVMLEYDEPLDVDFEGAHFEATDEQTGAGTALAWMKRQGPTGVRPERWVLQAHATWSARHLEDEAEGVAQALLDAVEAHLSRWGVLAPTPVHCVAHRWRYARARVGPGADDEGRRVCTDPRGLVLAGDWIAGSAGARIESAWLSGVAAAGHVLAFAADGPDALGGSPNRATPGHATRAGSEPQRDLFHS